MSVLGVSEATDVYIKLGERCGNRFPRGSCRYSHKNLRAAIRAALGGHAT